MAQVLTPKFIENVKPAESRQEIPDAGMPGLYLVVQPSGAMSWSVRYRFDGRPRKFTIGSHPAFKLADARKAASAVLRSVSEGRDPIDEKKAAASARTRDMDRIENLFDDFHKRYVLEKNRPSTATEKKRTIDVDIVPKWKGRMIGSVTRRDVLTLIDEAAERAPIQANRVHALLSKFFNWCIERDIITASPMVKLKPPSQERHRDRILTKDEVRLVWLASEKIGWPFGTMVKLLLLTGQRRTEVAGAERGEFDLKENEASWTIPKDRSKNGKAHFVPLPQSAAEIVRSVPQLEKKSTYLLTTTGESAISGFSRAKGNLDAEMIKIARKEIEDAGGDPDEFKLIPWRLHDLRRTAASGMASLGIAVHVVEAVLNHRSGSIKGVAAVYNKYEYADEKRRALSAWDQLVAEIVGIERPDNVIPMKSAV